MLVRADSLAKSMSHYLIEQIAALRERRGAHRLAAAGGRGRRRARARAADARARTAPRAVEEVDAVFVFIGATPRTDWLEGVVARDERGFILAGADVKAAGWPLQPRPLSAGDERPGRLRRRRRARALDQARGQRGGGGVDGGLAHPRVPGPGMSTTAGISVADLRPVDLFDDLDDAQLAEWAAVAQRHALRARRAAGRAGRRGARPLVPARGRGADRDRQRRPHRARRAPGRADLGRRHRRPHPRAAGRAHGGHRPVRGRAHPGRRLPPPGARASAGARPRHAAR